MLAEIRPTQLAEWLAYFRINPWGERRADLRVAHQTLNLVTALGGKRVDGAKLSLADVMLRLDEPEEPDPQSLSRKIRQFFANRKTR